MLVDLLRRATAQDGAQPLLLSATGALSYAECLRRSEAVARGLLALGSDRFGCALTEPGAMVSVLAGATAAGSEACPYPPDLEAAELSAVAERFGHRVLITDRVSGAEPPRRLTPEALAAAAPGDSAPLAKPGSAPVLILTTGTTGERKAARHDWARLAGAVRRPDTRPGTRWLLVHNLNQFAGVQLLVHALVSRATLVAPASRRADEVIEAIRAHAVTHASATPTFWRLLAGRLDAAAAAELPLEQITLGGEPAPQSLLDQLRRLFPAARISHVYAGTEFGSAIAVHDGRSGLPLSVLDRDPSADVRLRVVGGELQARSRVGMLGYHARPDDEEDWRPTGDLVEVGLDRLHFVGRTSEIINVGGAKVHPLPVEEVICSVEGVEVAAVYGHPNAVTGQIVAADVVAAPGTDASELTRRIRDRCRELPAAGRPRRIRIVSEPELRGNKLVRGEPRSRS